MSKYQGNSSLDITSESVLIVYCGSVDRYFL